MLYRFLSIILSVTLTLTPIIANAGGLVVDGNVDAGRRAVISSTGGGRPVVGIAAAGAGGTSHNAFTEYNVGAEGVILNNGVGASASRRDGVIGANTRLGGVPARVILNEVTGVSPSRLAGETEVVGSSAAVVVANPNGVACDGCSFVNTPRVTLSTGKPGYNADGSLALTVQGGSVAVEGRGLVQAGVGQVDLVGGQVQVDAPVVLDRDAALSVIAGHGRYDHTTGRMRADANVKAAPDVVAIDASALGALQAGSIHVVSTDAGAGVRLDGNVASSVGDVVLDAEGNIQLGAPRQAGVVYAPKSVTSKNNLVVRSSGRLSKNSNSYSYKDTSITADAVDNTGRIEADNDVSVTIAHGYENSGKLDAARDMRLDVGGNIRNSGIVDTGRDLVVHAGGDVANDNIKITAGGTITVQGAGSLLNRDTDMYARGGIVVNTRNLQHRGVSYLGSDGTVRVDAVDSIENLDHDSVIQATAALALIAGNRIDNRLGQILGGSDILLRAPVIDNRGGLIAALGSQGGLVLDASGMLDNRGGFLSSVNGIRINAGVFDNSNGTTTAGGRIDVAATDRITNDDGILLAAGDVLLQASGLISNIRGAVSSEGGSVRLDAHDIDTTAGAIQGKTGLELVTQPGGTLTATGAFLQTDGTLRVASGGDLNLSAASLLGGRLLLEAGGAIYAPYSTLAGLTQVDVLAGGLVTLAGSAAPVGSVLSNGIISIHAGALETNRSNIQSSKMLDIQVAGDVTGSGTLFSGQSVHITSGGLLENTLASYRADVDVVLQSGGDTVIDGSSLLANGAVNLVSGGLLSANDTNTGFVLDGLGNQIVVTDLLNITAAGIEARRSALMGNGMVSVQAIGGDATLMDAVLFSNTGVTLASGGSTDISRSMVVAPDALAINAGSNVVVSDASVVSNADIMIDAGGMFVNTGSGGYVLTGGDVTTLTINAGAVESTGGALLANHAITLTATGDLLLGSMVHSNTDLFLTTQAGNIINQGGDVTVVGDLIINTQGNVINSGTILVQDGFSLATAGMFDNSGGTLSTQNAINVNAGSISNVNGLIESGSNIALTGTGGIDNSNGRVFASGTFNATSNGMLTNNGGRIESLGTLVANAASGISNFGGTITTNGSLNLTAASGAIDNRQAGSLYSAGDLTMTALDTYNGGHLGVAGNIISGGTIRITTLQSASYSNNLSNGHGGYVEAAGDIILNSAGRVGNIGGSYIAGGNITVNAAAEINNLEGGLMQAGNNLALTSGTAINNENGTLHADRDVALTATAQSFLVNGVLSSTLYNSGGSITSGGAMAINVRDLDNTNGSITSDGNLTIHATNNGSQVNWGTSNNGGLIHSNGNIVLDTTWNFSNIGGELSAVGGIQLDADTDIDNHLNGLIRGGGAVALRNYAGNLYNYDGGRIESSTSVLVDLGQHVPNPDYALWQQQVAAYNGCLADPACVPGAAPGPAPAQFIRGDVFNAGGVITAPMVTILARAIFNDPIFGQGTGGTPLSTAQILALFGPGSANGNVDDVNPLVLMQASNQAAGDQAVGGPSLDAIRAYINGLPGADQLSEAELAYLAANYGNLARVVLDTSNQVGFNGGGGIGNLASILSGNALQGLSQFPGATLSSVNDPNSFALARAAQQLLQQAIGFFINENQQASSGGRGQQAPLFNINNLAQLAPASGGGTVAPAIGQLAFLSTGNLQGGQIIADDLNITADEGIYNVGGTITARNTGTLTAKRITNRKVQLADGTLEGGEITGGNLTLNATESLVNSGGKIKADGLLAITAGSLTNEALTDAAGNILAKGKLRGNDIQLTLQNQLTTTKGSVINADNALSITALQGITNNQGAVLRSGGDAQFLTQGTFLNKGEVIAGRLLAIQAADINNEVIVERQYERPGSGRYNDVVQQGTGMLVGDSILLNASNNITNTGGSIVSGSGGVALVAGNNITNESVTFTGTNANGYHPITFHGGEILSGGDVDLIAGNNLTNRGSSIAGEGDVMLAAGNNIDILTDEATYVSFYKKGWSGKRISTTAVQQGSNITSASGDVSLVTGAGDIKVIGSSLQAPVGTVLLSAGRDIVLDAEETEEYNKRSKFGFSGIGIGRTTTKWNDHNVSLASILAGDIVLDAGRDFTAAGALLFSGNDIAIQAGRDLTFDSAQVTEYLEQKGWTYGYSFPGSAALVALAEGRIGDVGEALLNESPLYGAVKGLSQMKSGTDLAPLMNAGIQGFNTASSIASGYNQSGRAGAGSALLGTAGFNTETGISGFTARFGTFKSREEHTESYLSQLNAGRDVILSSGRDVNLIGGTQVDAGRNIVLDAARDLTIAANRDWTRYKSSSAGVSVGVSGGGITVGADGSAAKSNSETYTNARLTAGNALVFGSGRDTVIAGANLQARDIIGTVGGNLVVASVQNQLHSSNKSASGSVTVGPAPGASFSAASGKTDRSFTDDVTSVIGTESVDIAVGGNTHIKGAVVANAENGVDKGNLVLNTGTLTFEDIIDSDKSQQKSISASYTKGSVDAQGKTVGAIPGVASGGFSSSNTQGITRATIGAGTIEIRDPENQTQDVASLNRDVTKVQEITKSSEHTYSIAVPLATPEQIKSGLNEIKTAGKTLGKQIDIAQTTNALEKAYGKEAAAEGKEMLERWAAGDAHALDGCIGGGSAWNFFVSEAYANPVALGAAGCSLILAAAVVTAVNSGNQQLLPDSIRNDTKFLEQLDLTLNDKGEIIQKDAYADTSFSCRLLGNCELKLPSDEEKARLEPAAGSVAATGGGGLEPDQEPGDDPRYNNLSKEDKKSINSLEKRIEEHQKKLEDYIRDPEKFDNKGYLKNAPSPEVRQNIIDGRVSHLKNEIKAFRSQVNDIVQKSK